MANALSNWQDALNQRLVNRLTRPLYQPGMMNMAMGQRIINRCDRFLTRLPLLNQQIQRWSNTNTLSDHNVPIVYAQPTPLIKAENIENQKHNSQPIVSQNKPAATVIQRKLDLAQAVPNSTVNNLIPVPNRTDLPNTNFGNESAQFLPLDTQIDQTSISASEIPVVAPLSISEELPKTPEMRLADLTQSPISSPTTSELNLNYPSQAALDTTSTSSPEIAKVAPQAISNTSLPIVQAKLQNYSSSQSSLLIINNLNTSVVAQQKQQNNYSNSHSIIRESLISPISAKALPIVTPQTIKSENNWHNPEISLAINNQDYQNQQIINTQHVNISNSQINQTHHQQNTSSLPLVSITSSNNPSLNPQSLPLPLAKATPSSWNNRQQPNLPSRNSISNTDASSTTTKTFASASSPTETSVSPIATRNVEIDINAIASQVERKLMRKVVIESERRGKIR